MAAKRLVGALVAAGALLLGTASTGWAADPSSGSANAMGYHLALGDSLAAGYQPDRGAEPAGGYADDVLAGVRATEPKTTLVNLACPGERSTTMVSGGVCPYEEGSQLDQALEFLHAHGRYTRVVTVQIGANDVQRCVSRTPPLSIDYACIQAGMADVQTYLPTILGKLGAEAPNAQLIVVNYYNPFLAAYLTGNVALAQQSTVLQGTLNGILATAASRSDAVVADVATNFNSTDTDPFVLPGVGTVPTNVAYICLYTWMCTKGDIHANDEGYALIGEAVVARLG